MPKAEVKGKPKIAKPKDSGPSHAIPSPEFTRSSVSDEIQMENIAAEIQQTMTIGTAAPKVCAKFPQRPEPKGGTDGRVVSVKTNHFRLSIEQNVMVYHYDIEIEKEMTEMTEETVEEKATEEPKRPEKRVKQQTIKKKIAAKMNRKIFFEMVKQYDRRDKPFHNLRPVYDGQKNMYTSRVIPGTEERAQLRLIVEINENDRINKYWVNMKLTQQNERIDLGILNPNIDRKNVDDQLIKEAIMALDIILRYKPTMVRIPLGQSLYYNASERKRIPIGGRVELAYGNYQSVRNVMCGPTLNVDRSAACFVTPNTVGDLMGMLFGRNTNIREMAMIDERQRRKLNKEIEGIQIEATHMKYGTHFRKYRVLKVSRNKIKDEVFEWKEIQKDGTEKNHGTVSVANYFKQRYKIKLNENLPCIVVGNEKNKINLPIEVCKIVENQRVRRALTNIEKSDMTRDSAAQKPFDRMNLIENYVKSIKTENTAYLFEFKIDIEVNPMHTNGRIIDPPNLVYGRDTRTTPEFGHWDMNRKTFYKPANLNNWLLVDMSAIDSRDRYPLQQRDYDKFIADIGVYAKELGMEYSFPLKQVRIENYRPNAEFIKKGIFMRAKQLTKNLKLIWFIMPDKKFEGSDALYSEIKYTGDSDQGIVTQCICKSNFKGSRNSPIAEVNRSVIKNILLKVNAKLGGTNVVLNRMSFPQILKSKNVMIVGADVNHPAPADKVNPSIAAAVGSYDENFCKYVTTVSLQIKSNEEMIKNMDKMMITLLKEYRNANRKLPNEIIFYRDGVSESQFAHVVENEVPLIRKAFADATFRDVPNYNPKLTLIAVQKRHHTRFIPSTIRGGEKQQNIVAGTVIDQTVVHPKDFDFYLCSHEGIQGMSRPAHYYVLVDENKFSSNDLQKITYYMCHVYVRCTRSVSIPTPVYYADLAAYRAKVILSGAKDAESETESVMSGDVPQPERHRQRIDEEMKRIQINDALIKEIFYC